MTRATGQEPFLKNYTVSNGLAGQNIYKMLADRKGFLWFCTEDGVSRFNGFDFENYNSSNGFPGDGALTAEMDRAGRIWFITLGEQLCFYDPNGFHDFKTPYPVSWISFSRRGDMFLLTTKGHVLQYVNGKLSRDITVCEGAKLHTGCCLPDGKLIVHSAYIHRAFTIDNGLVRSAGFTDTSFSFLRFSRLQDNTVLASNNNAIYQVHDDTLLPVYRHTGRSMVRSAVFCVFDAGSELWLGASNGLFACDRDLKNVGSIYDKGIVTSVIEDKTGNYWVATWSNGVYTFRSKGLTNLFFPNRAGNNVKDIKGYDRSHIFVFYENGIISQVQFRKGQLQLRQITANDVTINKVTNDGDGRFTLQTTDGPYVFDGRRTRRVKYARLLYATVDSFQYSLDAASGLQRKWKGRAERMIAPDQLGLLQYLSVRSFAAKKDTVVLADKDSLFMLTRFGLTRKYRHPAPNCSIADMVVDRDGTFWVAYRGQGVYYIRDGRLTRLGPADGLYAANCSSVFIDDQNSVWISSREGLYKVIRRQQGYAVENFNWRSLLPSLTVSSICKEGNSVFAVTDKGLSYFDEATAHFSPPVPEVFITAMAVDNRDTVPSDHISLPHDRNNLRFDFTSMDYSSLRRPVFYYCLRGSDSVWVPTKQSSINFSTLQPGAYRLYVAAENMYGKRSAVPASLSFSIRPPFWLSWWFCLLIASLAAGIILAILRHYKQISRRERAYMEAELRALRLHMNPHFIFNTLNSLQTFIFNNNPLEANNYISKFSRLIRWTMNNSDRSELTLEEELAYLKTYVDLEQIRFEKKKLLFRIDVDPAIDQASTIIPAFVIQPFVENAIKYGLSGKEGPCVLQLTLRKRANFIDVTVRDNGIGRERVKSEQAQSPRPTSSTGIKYTEERLRLLINNGKVRDVVRITDLYEDTEPAGTKVELTIPVLV